MPAVIVRGGPEAQARAVKPTQCLVECHDVPLLGVIGEERKDLWIVSEHLLHKAVERALGADLDEHSAAGVVERSQSFDELHR